MGDMSDKLKNAKEKIAEVGVKAKDSKAAELMTRGIKGGAETVAKGAKLGVDVVTKGVKSGAEKVKETVGGIGANKVHKNNNAIDEKSSDTVNVKDILNTVIDGAYEGQKVTSAKNRFFIGEKEVTTLNCECYRNPEKRECVIHAKELFKSLKKKSMNPLDKMINDNYITVVWRTGEKSVLCVDSLKKAMVIKLLS